MQRRRRDKLQSASKRRSIATCSSRDKEMDGIALESVLQNFFTNRLSRRRSGRPSSTHGSPTSGSPNNGSLSEITSQVNLSNGRRKGGGFSGVKDMGKKEWNSAAELTENSPHKKAQPRNEDNEVKGGIPHEEEMKTSTTQDSTVFTHSVNRTPSTSSTDRPFSATTDDGDEDLQDNNEEEAQKLREASKKVLRFQNSRGSTSSGDFSLENQKSPGAKTKLPRQRTFDEETDRYPGDPTNEDLVRFLLSPQPSSKRVLGRRHTLPTKVLKTEVEGENPWTQPAVATPKSAARVKGTPPADGAGHNPSKQVFDFTDVFQNFTKSVAQDQNSPSAEKKSKPDVGLGEQNQGLKSVEPTGNQRNNENSTSKSTWMKTDTSGLFFSFLRRLGDMSKLPNSKETAQKGAGSGV